MEILIGILGICLAWWIFKFILKAAWWTVKLAGFLILLPFAGVIFLLTGAVYAAVALVVIGLLAGLAGSLFGII